MAPNTQEELDELMIFIGKKVKDVKTSNDARLFSMSGLAKQFKKEIGSTLTDRGVRHRMEKARHGIHKMEEIDVSTKVKMIMILWAPVDPEFLIELRKNADVEVDEELKIRRYKAHDGSLELDADVILKDHQHIRRANLKPVKSEFKASDQASTSSSSANGLSTTSNGRKRRRISESENGNEENDGENDDFTMNYEFEDSYGDDFDYDPPHRHPENIRNDEMAPEQKPQFLIVDQVEDNSEESTSIRDLLILLRAPVLAIKSPSLRRICTKLDAKIQEIANGTQQIQLHNLHFPLGSYLFLLIKSAVSECEEESTSLKDFLMRLQAATCHLDHPSLKSFTKKLDKSVVELSACDKRISTRIIDRAMDHTLLMLHE